MILRTLEKDDISVILDSIISLDGATFNELEKVLGLPKYLLSQILSELEFFKLIEMPEKSRKYYPNENNIQLWKKYNRELDYLVFAKSDNAKAIHEGRGVNCDVPKYEDTELNNIGWFEDEIY